jgi:hypothetical protein
MKKYKVLDEFDDVTTIKLHDQEILPHELKEDGKWPANFSPFSSPSYEPHYSVWVYKDADEKVEAIYRAQFFVEDLGCDSFIVEVVHTGDCETYMHLHQDSELNTGILDCILTTVLEIECILPQIAEQHDKFLGVEPYYKL